MPTESKSATIRTGSLRLDPKNTRIPADRRTDDQRALLHELLEHEDVKSLAGSIAKLGLFPNERLVVTPDGRHHVVLEGNRRLAAIKLLLNPELAPTSAQVRHFRRLSAKINLATLGKLEVAVVENRVAASPIIAALHTREAKKRWSSLQQARFYRELVDEGQTPAEIAEDLGVSLGQVNGYLRAEKLYRVAVALEYPPAVRRKIEDPKFPLTTLERFIESTVARSFLGIDLDEETGFRGKVHPDRFKAVLKKVATDVATVRGLTRRINNEKGFKAYIAEANKQIPKTLVRGRFSPDDIIGAGEGGEEPVPDPVQKKQPRRKPTKESTSIIPRGFQCRSRHERVRAIFEELKGMRIKDHRNSSGVMLRVLLDIALWSYLKDQGHTAAVLDHCDPNGKRRNLNADWTPTLKQLISFAVEKRLFPGMAADGYKAVRSLVAKDAAYFITIDGFNFMTHNQYVTPTEGDLRAMWQRAEPMLEIILN